MALETPEYELISKDDGFEIRRYSEMIIATTSVQADYKSSTSSGFRRIASYIFGGNDKEMKIAMTAPVISDCPSEGLNTFNISFVMPKEYSIDDLPKANTSLVSIEQESLGDVAVLTFGGWATESRSISYQQKLSALLKKSSIESQGGFMVAQFNSPWTLPMFRKNELMVRIINKSSVN
tara:strand:- start:186 stop:722 length:537 start_codon:yes stop_codon:yes gene_type:complete